MTQYEGEVRRSAETVERLHRRRLSFTDQDLIRVVADPSYGRWLDLIKAIGGCAHPIYLSGSTTTFDAGTGEIRHQYSSDEEPGGRLPVRCGNRRHSRCPSCAYLHQGDTYQLVRSGLRGGKGVPAGVSAHPRAFLTLTAPSFGPVHRATSNGACRPRRAAERCEHGVPAECRAVHLDGDVIGSPLCSACYDYTSHVLWNATAGTLWNRYCQTFRRRLAAAGGLSQSDLRKVAVVSFAKAAEYQRRGAIHFHAVIRVDGKDGPASSAPSWITSDLLCGVAREAADATELTTPYADAIGEIVMRWGEQIDVHPITSVANGLGAHLTDDAVASYIAKYITKSDDHGGVDYRIRNRAQIELAPVSDHVRSLMTTCWRLSLLAELNQLNLSAWIHSLGFRGHVLTKSRKYSTTYRELQEERAEFARGESDSGAVTVADWRYVGSGYSLAESDIAAGIAEDAKNLRALRKELREEEEL
ncbi:replication initiator [Streptomyces albidoflavus]